MLSQSSEDIFKALLSTDKSLGMKGDWGLEGGNKEKKVAREHSCCSVTGCSSDEAIISSRLMPRVIYKTCSQKHWSTRWLGNGREEMLGGAEMNKQRTGTNSCTVMTYLQHVTKCKNIHIRICTDIHDVTNIHMAQMSVYRFLLNGESFTTWTPDCMEE